MNKESVSHLWSGRECWVWPGRSFHCLFPHKAHKSWSVCWRWSHWQASPCVRGYRRLFRRASASRWPLDSRLQVFCPALDLSYSPWFYCPPSRPAEARALCGETASFAGPPALYGGRSCYSRNCFSEKDICCISLLLLQMFLLWKKTPVISFKVSEEILTS